MVGAALLRQPRSYVTRKSCGFEKFIGAELRKALPDWNVNLQESQKHLSGDPKLFRLRPDIVIRKGSKTVVLDTKWKLLSDDPENHYNISEKDVYQIFAYARAYDITDVFLIYPKPFPEKL